MKIKSKTKKLLLEISAIVLAAFAMLLSFLADLSIFNIPDCFILRIQNTEDLLFNLFTVQATVTTMSIAIIALISGIISDSVYGISVTRFVIQLKPRIFKHKRLIIFSLIVTFINYFVVSYNLYNTSIAIFLLSIIISIILVKDVFVIFLGRKEIKKQMETYILENYQTIGIDNFKTSLLESDDISKKTFLKENFELIKKIFEKEVSVSADESKSELIVELETIISDTFDIIYQKKNSDALIFILNFISELYEIANNKDNSVPLTIWDNISRNYFKSLRLLSEEQLYNGDFFYKLYVQLYNNLKTEKSDRQDIQINCYDIKYYNVWIYYSLIINNNNPNKYDKKRLLKFLYGNIYAMFFSTSPIKGDKNKESILLSEWCIFVKALIDEGETETFRDEFIGEYRYHIRQNNYQVVFIISCIYLYYIGCREDLVNGKNAQKIAENIIKENEYEIRCALHQINLRDFLTNNLTFVNNQMRTWEVLPEKEAKCIILDSVINDFFVFTALNNHWNNEIITQTIQALIGENTFSLYTHYFGNDNKNFVQLFSQYISFFCGENAVNASTVKQLSELFKDVLSTKYKLEEIENGKKNIVTDASRKLFENNIQKTFERILNENSCLFEESPQKDIEYKKSKICLGELRLPSSIINDQRLDDYIEKYIHTSIINTYIYAISSALDIIRKKYNDGDLQETLISALKDLGITGDTFISNRSAFWNEKDKHLLSDFTKNMAYIKYPDGYNNFYVVDNSLVHCLISDLEVEFVDLNQSEIEQMCKQTDDGKLSFNVTNDIYIPFEKDELNEHIHRIKKKIVLYANVKFHLESEKVGAGIQIVFD